MDNTLALPKGWSREEVIRKSGLSAGKTDIYYYGPDGKKYRSRPQIARELGQGHDLAAFDFKAGNMIGQSSIIRKAKGKKTAYDFSKGLRGDASLSLPVRQTASIFKQPVTVIRSHPDSKVRHDLKHGPADSQQPRQLFWERSLTGLKCSDIDEDTLRCIGLPSKIQGISPDLSTENLLQSIAAALHLNNHPIVGQNHSNAKFTKNPTVHVNTNQPLIQQVVVNDEDIRQQENKVEGARKKLEELLAAIEKSNREMLEKEDRPMSADSAASSHSGTSSSAASKSPPAAAESAGAVKAAESAGTVKAAESGTGRSRKRKASPNKSPEQSEEEKTESSASKAIATSEPSEKVCKSEPTVEEDTSEGSTPADKPASADHTSPPAAADNTSPPPPAEEEDKPTDGDEKVKEEKDEVKPEIKQESKAEEKTDDKKVAESDISADIIVCPDVGADDTEMEAAKESPSAPTMVPVTVEAMETTPTKPDNESSNKNSNMPETVEEMEASE